MTAKIVIAAIAAVSGALFVAAPTATSFAALQESPGANVLHSGEWERKTQRSAGTWKIYEEGGKTYVSLSEEFRTRNAPDLKIFLSPLAAGETNGRNATDGSLLVAPLKSNRGAQTYELPDSVDLAAYKSILIHCEEFSKLWSAADLA